MLSVEQVVTRARVLALMTTEESLDVRAFCETAAVVISEKMRAGADASDLRLITAAATLALYNYYSVKYAAEGDAESFKAGDVTVSYNGNKRIQTIENIKKAAFADARDLLVDDGFIFESI